MRPDIHRQGPSVSDFLHPPATILVMPKATDLPTWAAGAASLFKAVPGDVYERAAGSKTTYYVFEGGTMKRAVDAIVTNLKKGQHIKRIEFWGHGGPGSMKLGNEAITRDAFGPSSELTRLLPYLDPDAVIYFRGCETFRGTVGREFAEKATKFFNRTVAGHTLWIGKLEGPVGNPTFPGYEELRPGKKPSWVDPPSNAPRGAFK